MLGRPRDSDADKGVGEKRPVIIMEAAADLEGTGRGVVGVVDEIDDTLVWKARFAFQLEVDRDGGTRGSWSWPPLDLVNDTFALSARRR